MSEIIILEELRRLILLKIGIKIVSPSDCRFISSTIQKELNKTISATTIKRLFGFAEIQNQFSKYTINTLIEYVEDLDFKRNNTISLPNEINEINTVRQKAKGITLTTTKYIRNRSSLPYYMTIGRKFATYDFEHFYNSNKSYTAFISQPGYGKSILLNHLVEDLFMDASSIYKDDVILFINALDIFGLQYEELSFEDRIIAKLELNTNTNLIDYFNKQYALHNTKLIVVIDGFPETCC